MAFYGVDTRRNTIVKFATKQGRHVWLQDAPDTHIAVTREDVIDTIRRWETKNRTEWAGDPPLQWRQ